jgi:hypothetical protein
MEQTILDSFFIPIQPHSQLIPHEVYHKKGKERKGNGNGSGAFSGERG